MLAFLQPLGAEDCATFCQKCHQSGFDPPNCLLHWRRQDWLGRRCRNATPWGWAAPDVTTSLEAGAGSETGKDRQTWGYGAAHPLSARPAEKMGATSPARRASSPSAPSTASHARSISPAICSEASPASRHDR